MMVVVSDTSPISALSDIDLHWILPELFGEVVIPDAVRNELLAGPNRSKRLALLDEPWLRTSAIARGLELPPFVHSVDLGELEAIRLAIALSSNYLLVDDRAVRRAAGLVGINVIGTLGVMRLAKERELIGAVVPFLRQLRLDHGFRIAETTALEYLHKLGEDGSQFCD